MGVLPVGQQQLDALQRRVGARSPRGGLGVDVETGAVPMFPPLGAAGLRLSAPLRLLDRRPVRSNWVRTACHPADVEAMVEQARYGTLPITVQPTDEVPYLLVKSGALAGTVRRVNAATVALLGLCDGRTSVAEIVTRMTEAYPDSGAATLRALRSLAQDRAIRL